VFCTGRISRERNGEKVKRPQGLRSNSGSGRQKEQLRQATNAKESPKQRRPTSIGQTVEGGGDVGKHACLVSDHNVENVFFEEKLGGGGPLPTCINNEKYSVHAVCTCRSKEQRICFHMFCFFSMCAMLVFSYCRSFQV
jgi:hypothetical protein